MNYSQIISMVMRMFVRKAVNHGMNAGINHFAGGGKAPEEMSPEERERAKSARQTAKHGKTAMRMVRRIGRF